MGKITVIKDVEGIRGLHVITPHKYGDSRGWFMETYNRADLLDEGVEYHFLQDNQSLSIKGVLRGMHFQKNHPQTKLIRVTVGEVFDVAVDMRKDSPTYGKWHSEILSSDNCKQVLIPKGFAHGFLTLSDNAELCYKCDDYYHPEDESGFIWNDPSVGIDWPIVKTEKGIQCMEDGTEIILSDKDRALPSITFKQKEEHV